MSPSSILDERFKPLRQDRRRKLDHLYDGCRWAEGPAYFPAHRALVWSDIPNDRMLRYDEATGDVGVFRSPAGYTNGHTVDAPGPAGQLRARQPPRHAHRARRHDHRARRRATTASG